MTVGSQVRQMIEDALLSAYIKSPRFDDYYVDSVEVLPKGLEGEVDKAIKQQIAQYLKKNTPTQYDQHVKMWKKQQTALHKQKQIDIERQMEKISGFTANPKGAILSLITKNMAILGPIMAPFLAVQITEQVIEILTRPGFPLDPRFKRRLEEEYNSFLARQTQFNSAIGARNVVVQTKAGWINANGAGHRSTMKDIREGTGRGVRQGFIGIEDKSIGMSP
jgi:uncharacterized protein YllA (UPF0747 family)